MQPAPQWEQCLAAAGCSETEIKTQKDAAYLLWWQDTRSLHWQPVSGQVVYLHPELTVWKGDFLKFYLCS